MWNARIRYCVPECVTWSGQSFFGFKFEVVSAMKWYMKNCIVVKYHVILHNKSLILQKVGIHITDKI